MLLTLTLLPLSGAAQEEEKREGVTVRREGGGLTTEKYEEGPEPWRSLTVSTGFDYSEGDYGASSDTKQWYVPMSLRFEWEPVFIKVTVPWLFTEGPGVVGGGEGGGVPVGGGFSSIDESGLGDVILSAGYTYYPSVSSWLPVIEVAGKIKFGTADEDDFLGTGKNDYTIGLELSKTFAGRFTPFVAGGYRFMGGSAFDNRWLAAGGMTIELVDDRLYGGMAYDFRERAVDTAKNTHELSPYFTIKLLPTVSLNPYAVIGLSKFAPDWGMGLGVSWRFWGNY
jgi:hypothetical protein